MANCESCGATIPSSAISTSLRAARCPHCGTLVDLDRGMPQFVAGTARKDAMPAPIPERWTIEDGMRGLSVRWSWFQYTALILIPFALFWNGIMVAMGVAATDHGQHLERLLIGLAIPHVWIGMGLIYFILATFLNSTTISAYDGQLLVRKGPLPWFGNRTLGVVDIEQLFVLEKHGNKGKITYELCAVMRDGRNQSVLTGIDSLDQARFLESKFEQYLHIEDRPVPGEAAR
jgi:hypothetical protein